jgi:hypothetical protein
MPPNFQSSNRSKRYVYVYNSIHHMWCSLFSHCYILLHSSPTTTVDYSAKAPTHYWGFPPIQPTVYKLVVPAGTTHLLHYLRFGTNLQLCTSLHIMTSRFESTADPLLEPVDDRRPRRTITNGPPCGLHAATCSLLCILPTFCPIPNCCSSPFYINSCFLCS